MQKLILLALEMVLRELEAEQAHYASYGANPQKAVEAEGRSEDYWKGYAQAGQGACALAIRRLDALAKALREDGRVR